MQNVKTFMTTVIVKLNLIPLLFPMKFVFDIVKVVLLGRHASICIMDCVIEHLDLLALKY